MRQTITLNGKTYEVPNVDFNAICELEEKGFSLADLSEGKIGFRTMRAVVAWALSCSPTKASEEIESLIKEKGQAGLLEELEPIFNALADSDFFKNLMK